MLEQVKKDDRKSLRVSNLEYIPKYIAVSKKDSHLLVHGTYGYKGMELLDSNVVRVINNHQSSSKTDYINFEYVKTKD